MSRVFLMGPLTWQPLLELILGPQSQSEEVMLKNVALGPSDAFPFPHIKHGAQSRGISLALDDPAAFQSLNYFAAACGAFPVPKHGYVNGMRCSGVLFVTDGPLKSPSMSVDDWIRDWGDIALVAAREILSYKDRFPAPSLNWRMSMILSRARAERDAGKTAPTQIRQATTRNDVMVHGEDAPHAGFFLTRSYTLQHPRFDRTHSDILNREVFVAADAVIVLPYDARRDCVLLVEQFRMGPFGRGDTFPWVLEPPAGRVDAGETVENAARRECEEEAGLTLSRLEHVSSHYCSPGASTEFYHCYVALTDLPDEAAGFGGLHTEHEDIKTHILTFDDVMHLLSSGEINVGPLILLLLWLQRERPRLRSLA